MRQSQLFGKTIRESPKDEVSNNAILLERGGFVHKTMAGVYDYLPLGWRVLEKINGVIRDEMNGIGASELFLSALQPKERWEKSGRWKILEDIMYQFKDHSGREIGLATTHEEAIAEIALGSISSWRDLPLLVYQIQTKFRDEPRAKSGLMRGREFMMKDLYSFHRDQDDLNKWYGIIDGAYSTLFSRCGLDAYMTEAAGGTFTKEYTHEYQVLTQAGEDWILYCASCRYAQNKEISSLKEGNKCPTLCGGAISMGRSVEVGNIFKLGTKFSEHFGLQYLDEKGEKRHVVMGSYGIGPGRLLGTIAEIHHDDRGLIWPREIAPFYVHVLGLSLDKPAVKKACEKLYQQLLAKGIEVLYDDREEKTAGEKFADADLIGIPLRLIVSPKTLDKKLFELKRRHEMKAEMIPEKEVMKYLNENGVGISGRHKSKGKKLLTISDSQQVERGWV